MQPTGLNFGGRHLKLCMNLSKLYFFYYLVSIWHQISWIDHNNWKTEKKLKFNFLYLLPDLFSEFGVTLHQFVKLYVTENIQTLNMSIKLIR